MTTFQNQSCTYLSEKVFREAEWCVGSEDIENKDIILLYTLFLIWSLEVFEKKKLRRSGSYTCGWMLSSGLGWAHFLELGGPRDILWPKHDSAPFWKAAAHLTILTANQYFIS